METIVTRWWWIRHAPVFNPTNIVYGQMDLDADVSDSKTFKRLAEILPSDSVLFTSDLKRTVLTAEAIAQAGANLPRAIEEPALREQHFGIWQGKQRGQFGDTFNNKKHKFWIAPAFERAPKGESFADVIARVAPAITNITTKYAGNDIVCVSHGGTIRAAIAIALGLGPEKALSITAANCSLTRLAHITDRNSNTGVWSIETINFDPSI
tara:strand:+ start:136 stop:765 length:630 start_codon:yes stop_codon:yes gene_type:complete